MKMIIISLIIALSMIVTGCPKDARSQLKAGADASYRLAGATGDAITATDKAYTDGMISLETKDKLAELLLNTSKGGKAFNEALTALSKEFPAGNVPPGRAIGLRALFSDGVIAPFLQILQIVNLIKPEAADYLRLAIAAVNTLILTIQGSFEKAGVASITGKEVAEYA